MMKNKLKLLQLLRKSISWHISGKIYSILHSSKVIRFLVKRDRRLIFSAFNQQQISAICSHLSSGHGLAALCRCRDRLEKTRRTALGLTTRLIRSVYLHTSIFSCWNHTGLILNKLLFIILSFSYCMWYNDPLLASVNWFLLWEQIRPSVLQKKKYSIYLSIYLSFYRSIVLSIYRSIYRSIYHSIYRSIYLLFYCSVGVD